MGGGAEPSKLGLRSWLRKITMVSLRRAMSRSSYILKIVLTLFIVRRTATLGIVLSVEFA
jgi:hypothetical protein